METLFKFALTRAPVEQSEEAPSIPLAQPTSFQTALSRATSGSTARAPRKALARQFVASANFIAEPGKLVLGQQVAAVGRVLDELSTAEPVTPAELAAALHGAVGDVARLVDSSDYADDLSRLRDSVLAIKLLPEEHGRPIHRLVRALQDLELLRHVGPQFPRDAQHLRRFRLRSIALSIGAEGAGIVSDSILRRPRDEHNRGEQEAKRRAEVATEVARLRALAAAVDELARVPGDQLTRTRLAGSAESMPPPELRPLSLFEKRLETTPTRVSTSGRAIDTGVVVAGPAGTRGAFTGRSALRAEDLSSAGFRIADENTPALSNETKEALKKRGLSVSKQPVDEMVELLRDDIRRGAASLERLGGEPVQRSLKRFGGALVLVKTPLASPWADFAVGGLPGDTVPLPAPPSVEQLPSSHGHIAPAGIADLIIVKQQLVRYEATEVAHIENVLQGESKERKHRRLRGTEALTLRETEVTTSEERELATTDRFEMVRETNETIRESAAAMAGVTISGSYGPTVDFSASAEGATSRDREAATRTASTFSKETTQRSASRIAERVLQRESLKVTTEVEEENLHRLDNAGGSEHVRGVYQWIEKVYQAQMFNYGLRMIYDFAIAEPAAFLIETLKRGHASAVELEKPMRFSLRPSQISEFNYQAWIVEYGATDVVPPPEPYLTKSLDYSAGGGDESTDYNHSAQISIDDGYRAIHASVGVTGNVWDAAASVDVVIGQRANRIMNAGYKVWHTPLDNERGSVPFALNTFRQSDLAVAVEVKAQRTETAMNKWRHDTHAKLTTAYRARLAEYEEKLAELKVEAGVAIRGNNPAANLQLMNTEIRKACVSVLTDQHFDLFGAVENGTNSLPQLDLGENEAEGPYVRFFEQAFEWEHMTWLTYPYFWGRKSEWTDRIAFEDHDPLFADFLKAGYCRAVVPVRPGFEGAVDHFMTFGEPWVGGPLPTISSPLYLPIADELAERLDRPGEETPEGAPWEVRIPTNLVRLRDDGSLPSWTKDSEGNWVPQ